MNQKKQRTLAIFALAIALVATSIAYAALSATLSITGNVTKKKGSWSIDIQNISSVTTNGTGKMTTPPSVGTNGTLNFAAELAKPGDSVSFTFDLVNNGSVAATFDTDKFDIIIGNTAASKMYTDGEISDDNVTLSIVVKESDGTIKGIYADGLSLSPSGGKKTLKLTLTWDPTSHITTTESKILSVTANFPFKQA